MENGRFQTIVIKIKQFIQAGKAAGFEKVKSKPIVWRCYLADYFNYNVTQGGFAQLFYNLKGEHLDEIEELLSQMNAKTALEFYRQSLVQCLENIDGYQQFISEDYLDKNELKHELQRISIAYFNRKTDFEDEIKGFIDQNYSQIINEIDGLN